jgi:hypothetical protein
VPAVLTAPVAENSVISDRPKPSASLPEWPDEVWAAARQCAAGSQRGLEPVAAWRPSRRRAETMTRRPEKVTRS